MLSVYALQTMVDTLPVGAVVFTGTNHTISAANEQMLQIWNKSAAVLGKSLSSAIPEIDRQGVVEMLNQVYQSGESCRNPDGEAELLVGGAPKKVYFELFFKPLRDKDRNIYGVVCTVVDVTERVLASRELEQTVEELAATNEELTSLNEEYLTLNEEMEASTEELRAMADELMETKEHLERSLADLSEAEERVRLATDVVNVGTFDIDYEANRLITSKKLAELFGLEETADSETYVNFFHPDDIEIRTKAHNEALANGRLFYEARIITKDGVLRWVRAEGKVIYDKAGEPVRLLGTLMDITDQVQARETERKLKTLADNSADLMAILELDGVNSYINQAGKDLLGFASDEEVLATPIADLHNPEDFEQVQRDVLPAVMGEGRWIGTMNVRHLKTAEVFPVLNYTIRIDDPVSGKPLAVGAIMRDLRPELAAKKALADSEQLLRNVTSAAPTALWMANKEGKATYVNKTWLDWTETSFEQNLSSGWLQVIDPEDRQLVADVYNNALINKHPFEVEFRIMSADGNRNWYRASGQPQLDTGGNFNGFVGACIDITEQKQLLQHKDDFISIASHELKTPVTTLKASLQLMDKLKDKPDHPMFAKLIMQSRKSAERVGLLIDDLLNIGRLQQKEVKLNKTNFVVSQLLNACANPINISNRQNINITGDVELSVYADEHQIDQIVTNFLTNAVKYAPDANIIDIKISRSESVAKVEVTDYGPGIPEQKLKHLFERYYRVDENNNAVSGLGLGLYICKEIIERHGGRIGVDSTVGKGCTFWFTLPL